VLHGRDHGRGPAGVFGHLACKGVGGKDRPLFTAVLLQLLWEHMLSLDNLVLRENSYPHIWGLPVKMPQHMGHMDDLDAMFLRARGAVVSAGDS
jgi:hypothetical protein